MQAVDKDFGKAYQKLISQMLAVDKDSAAVFVPGQDLIANNTE